MKVKVDYHFHPNLPQGLPLIGRYFSDKRAKRIWEAFENQGLDAVIISEHAYKNPLKTFEILEKNKPKNAKTLIVPAIEALTKEGTDIIVFAKNKKDIYCYLELLTPWGLSMKDLISLVSKDDALYGIVVHPYTPGDTSIIFNNGMMETKSAIKKLGFVEGYNCSFTALLKLISFLKLNKIIKGRHERALKTANAPDSLKKYAKVVTGGSDAHHPEEIGDCMEIIVNKKEDLFTTITTKSGKMIVLDKKISTLIRNFFTVSREWLMKKTHLYTIDKPL